MCFQSKKLLIVCNYVAIFNVKVEHCFKGTSALALDLGRHGFIHAKTYKKQRCKRNSKQTYI